MNPPTVNQEVLFNVEGKLVPATVLSPWTGDANAVALKLGIPVEEAYDRNYMRATVSIDLGGGRVLAIKNAEYDADGQRNGTWTYPSDPAPSVEAVPGVGQDAPPAL